MYFITLVFKNLFRRKFRSILTLIGVAVAVCTMVTFLGIADDFETTAYNAFQKRGADIVVVQENVPNQLNSELNEDIANSIEKIPGVKRVTPGLMELISLSNKGPSIYAFVFGWKTDNPTLNKLEIIDGRRLEDSDHNVVMLGSFLAAYLKKKVGDVISIKHKDFKVIGVFRSFSVYENQSIISRLEELQKLFGHEKTVTAFTVTVQKPLEKPLSIESIAQAIRDLKDQKGKSLGLSALPTEEYITQSAHIRIVHAMAWITTIIALIIGTLSLANTMAMSVVERTREIGILRAIGWTKSRVIRMILEEAVIVSFLGGVLGTVGAYLLCKWLVTLPQVVGFIEGNISLFVIAESILATLCVGLIGGLWPAIRAAWLLPTEAIHHE
jgi:putative ABC transport system permease protein